MNDAGALRASSRSVFLRYWLPLLVWWAVMQGFSTDAFSADETSGLFTPLLRFFFPAISTEAIEILHFIFRKMCHATEYFIFGVLALRAVRFYQPSRLKAVVAAFAMVIVAAGGDEFHQSFTDTRTGTIVDVGYDAFGGIVALWVLGRKPRSAREPAAGQ